MGGGEEGKGERRETGRRAVRPKLRSEERVENEDR